VQVAVVPISAVPAHLGGPGPVADAATADHAYLLCFVPVRHCRAGRAAAGTVRPAGTTV